MLDSPISVNGGIPPTVLLYSAGSSGVPTGGGGSAPRVPHTAGGVRPAPPTGEAGQTQTVQRGGDRAARESQESQALTVRGCPGRVWNIPLPG